MALVIGLVGSAIYAQQTGSGVLPVTAPFTAGGTLTGPLRAPVTPTDCSAPQYSFTGDTDTGIGYGGANIVGIGAGGAPCRVSVSSTAVTSTVPLQVTSASNSYFTGGGSVGIGTTGPTKKLHVLGTAGGDYVGYVQSAGNTGNNYGFLVDGGTTSLDAAFQVRDSTGATSRLYVRGDGNVGIGTTTPTANTLQLGDTGTFGWSDVSLVRDAANTLAQRNGTNTQQLRIGPVASYLTFNKGNSTAGSISTVDAVGLFVGTNGTDRWQVSTAGHFLAALDNTYDIGASGATRPRHIYIAGDALGSSAKFTRYYGDSTGTSSKAWAPSDGMWQLTNIAETDLSLLIFGTNNAGGAAIAKSGTTLQFVNGNNTAYVPTQSLGHIAYGATNGIGYGSGAGGTVTQITSKSTGVTLNTVTGEITMNAAALAANTAVSFTLTNSAIAVSDYVMCQPVSGGTAGAYDCDATAAVGSATVVVTNRTAGSLSEAVVIKFVVFKAAIS